MDYGFEMHYDKDAFTNFVKAILTKHNIVANAEDVAGLILEKVTEEVMKARTGNAREVTFGIDDGKLEQAICKAYPYAGAWKKSKQKEQRTEYKANAEQKKATPKATPKTAPKTEKKVLRKPKKESVEEFDITQLELF